MFAVSHQPETRREFKINSIFHSNELENNENTVKTFSRREREKNKKVFFLSTRQVNSGKFIYIYPVHVVLHQFLCVFFCTIQLEFLILKTKNKKRKKKENKYMIFPPGSCLTKKKKSEHVIYQQIE